jgi:TonB-dependent starch-binding outer membrane protein SusC
MKKSNYLSLLVMRLLLLMAIILLLPVVILAQNITVKGVVTSISTGETMPGVNVLQKETLNGTTTGTDGSYSLSVPQGSILVFSYIGMKTQEISVGTSNVINVSLEEEATALEEVIVTGYSTERKVDVTGAVAIVNMDKVYDIPKANPMSTLQGRVPGLFIEMTGRPSGATQQVLIRGLKTLGNNDPLYIIDGVPTKRSVAFADLDPNSIESIQVLKDASASSIYGARASNGVIIVTTKAGKGKVRVEINSATTMQKRIREVDVLNTMERGEALWQASINDGSDPSAHAAIYGYDYTGTGADAVLNEVIPVEWIGGSESYGLKSQIPGTDWQDVVFRTGWVHNNTVTMSGGSENSTALLSVGYLKNKGVMEYQDYQKTTIRLNSSHKMLKDRLKIGENLNIASTWENPQPTDLGGANMEYLSRGMQPILPVYTVDGEWSGPIGAGFSDRNNPLHMLYIHRNNKNTAKLLFGNIFAEITPLKNMLFRSSFGLDYTDQHDWWVEEAYQTGFLGRAMNSLSETEGNRFNWSWSNVLTYNLDLGKSTFNFLVGMEAIKEEYKYMKAYKENFALNDDYDYLLNLSAGTGLQTAEGTGTGYQLLSYFGKINYGLSDKYLASFTLRYDGSSRFGTENQYGFFPAATLGWRINNEEFFQVSAISNLKLRAGVGRVGNQEIGDVARFGLYKPNYGAMYGGATDSWSRTWLGQGTAYDLNGVNTGTLPSGYSKEQTANESLKWETTDELNIGLDFGFLGQKITGSFDYFVRETRDILIFPPIPAAVGEGGKKWENGATVKTNGYEFSLGYHSNIGDFTYDVTGTLQHFADEITYLPEAVVRAYPGNVEKTIIGHSQRSLFGYKTDGLFQNQAEVDAHAEQPGKGVGRVRYKDLNGDNKIDPLDQDWLGTSLPKAEYGVNVDLGYKSWSLSVFMQGVAGKKDYDGWWYFATRVDNGMNFGKASLDAWTPHNTGSNIPALSLVNANDEGRSSDISITNHSYFKVRSIQLTYTLPTKALQAIKLERLRIFLLGENLILLKDKSGIDQYWGPDPEHGYNNPLPVGITFGLNLTF